MATQARFEGTPAQQRAKLNRIAQQERAKKAQLRLAVQNASAGQKTAKLFDYIESLETRLAALEAAS